MSSTCHRRRGCWPLLASLAFATMANTALAQGFDLFDPTRGMPKPTPTPPPAPPKPPPPPPPIEARKEPAKNFILRGTSRIGNTHRVYLQTPEQTEIKLLWREGEKVGIPGHPGYELRLVEQRRVGFSYPTDLPCVSNQELGVECFGREGLHWSSMLRRKATPPKPPAQPVQSVSQGQPNHATGSTAEAENGEEKPVNPFLQAINRAKERAAAKAAGEDGGQSGFQPKRIDQKDVPPGMRVVHTPFGDRLVPAR